MSPLSPNFTLVNGQSITHFPAQSGIAMVVTLILLLVITAMGIGIAYVTSMQSGLVAAVVDKPLSIDASETCFDNALEWLSTADGRAWLNRINQNDFIDLAAKKDSPLYGKTTFTDTTIASNPNSLRDSKLIQRLKNASYSNCTVTLLSVQTRENIGSEIGSTSGYGSRAFEYDISIAASGVVANNGFTSSKSDLVAVIHFIP